MTAPGGAGLVWRATDPLGHRWELWRGQEMMGRLLVHGAARERVITAGFFRHVTRGKRGRLIPIGWSEAPVRSLRSGARRLLRQSKRKSPRLSRRGP